VANTLDRRLRAARLAALDIATVALHWAAVQWPGPVGRELRRLADEMADRAKRLRAVATQEG
jgi:hypothetical protein